MVLLLWITLDGRCRSVLETFDYAMAVWPDIKAQRIAIVRDGVVIRSEAR